MAARQVLVCNFLEEEESHNSSNDNHVSSEIVGVMAVMTVAV